MFYEYCLIHASGPLHEGQGLLYIAVRGVALTHAENRRNTRLRAIDADVQGRRDRGQTRQCCWVDNAAVTAAITVRETVQEPQWALRDAPCREGEAE